VMFGLTFLTAGSTSQTVVALDHALFSAGLRAKR
jgi:hypothetical protein